MTPNIHLSDKAAEEHAKKVWNPPNPEDFIHTRKAQRTIEDFKAGVVWQSSKEDVCRAALEWVRLDSLKEPIIGVVLTMMPNKRVFAYDSDHGLTGLKEVMKHHPDTPCLLIQKPTESLSGKQEDDKQTKNT